MQKILFTACFTFLLISLKAQNKIDVLHYRYELELNDNNDSLFDIAGITFIAKEDVSILQFDLSKNNGRKGLLVSEILFSDPAISVSNFSQENDKLAIQPSTIISKGDTQSISLKYKGIPADGLIISKNKYNHRTFFADNWPNRGHKWLPCVDDPSDKASVEFIVTAPQHYQVVANGIQIEETSLPGEKKRTHWQEDVPVATKVMVIGVADFAVNLSGMVAGCIPVSSWVYPEDRDK